MAATGGGGGTAAAGDADTAGTGGDAAAALGGGGTAATGGGGGTAATAVGLGGGTATTGGGGGTASAVACELGFAANGLLTLNALTPVDDPVGFVVAVDVAVEAKGFGAVGAVAAGSECLGVSRPAKPAAALGSDSVAVFTGALAVSENQFGNSFPIELSNWLPSRVINKKRGPYSPMFPLGLGRIRERSRCKKRRLREESSNTRNKTTLKKNVHYLNTPH